MNPDLRMVFGIKSSLGYPLLIGGGFFLASGLGIITHFTKTTIITMNKNGEEKRKYPLGVQKYSEELVSVEDERNNEGGELQNKKHPPKGEDDKFDTLKEYCTFLYLLIPIIILSYLIFVQLQDT